MSANPFDDVTPIGVRPGGAQHQPITPQPDPLAQLSSDEKWRRREHTRANAEDKAGREHERAGKKNTGRSNRRPLKARHLIAMSSNLARKCYRLGISSTTKAHEAKQYVVAFGVLVDKLNALSGRPTEIIQVDDVRPAAHDLAAKIATARRSA